MVCLCIGALNAMGVSKRLCFDLVAFADNSSWKAQLEEDSKSNNGQSMRISAWTVFAFSNKFFQKHGFSGKASQRCAESQREG